MSRLIAVSFVILAFLGVHPAHSQQPSNLAADSSGYHSPPDSGRGNDSAYRARKEQLDRWIQSQQAVESPQDDFISVYAGYGAYLQILPRDLNQLFSNRSLRPDPAGDRNEFGTVDRAFILSGEAQLAETWGIYVEYDYLTKWDNTQVDSNAFGEQGAIEELDLTEHSFVVGGMIIFYNSSAYQLRADGGMGGVIALTSETESPGGYARKASATGYQFNFDLVNNFRVTPSLSFKIDFLARTTTTGELKTSSGQTLDAPFGARKTRLTISPPNASNFVYGLAAGLVFYF